jgi:hypothetical protein
VLTLKVLIIGAHSIRGVQYSEFCYANEESASENAYILLMVTVLSFRCGPKHFSLLALGQRFCINVSLQFFTDFQDAGSFLWGNRVLMLFLSQYLKNRLFRLAQFHPDRI